MDHIPKTLGKVKFTSLVSKSSYGTGSLKTLSFNAKTIKTIKYGLGLLSEFSNLIIIAYWSDLIVICNGMQTSDHSIVSKSM